MTSWILAGLILLILGYKGWQAFQRFRAPWYREYLTEEQFQRAINAIREYLVEKGIQPTFHPDGTITVTGQEKLEGNTFGMQNLVQVLASEQDSEIEYRVREWIGGILASGEELARLEKEVEDFENARKYLALRLYPHDYLSNLKSSAADKEEGDGKEENFLWRPEMEGVIGMVVFDFPSSVVSVSRNLRGTWGKPEDEIFQVALDNSRRMPGLKPERVELPENAEVYYYENDSFFTATRALFLDSEPGLVGPHGALVGIPTRHSVLCHPIRGKEVISAISFFLSSCEGMFRDGPGSLTRNIYWYKDGVFRNLPYSVSGKSIKFAPPAEFSAMIAGLGNPERD